jgi:hypothetical protein
MSELPEFTLRFVAVAQRAAGVRRSGRVLKLGDRVIGSAGLSEGTAGERARQRYVDRSVDLVSGSG